MALILDIQTKVKGSYVLTLLENLPCMKQEEDIRMLYTFFKQLQVQNILTRWIKGKNSHIKVICQALSSTQQLMKQVSRC